MASFDVLVVGGGHAGVEASLATAGLGLNTALVTLDKSAIGRMSCNPAIGGLAKGHLVREIDALGGKMGLLADYAGIQFKMLNRSKGKAVWSPRAQIDKKEYEKLVQEIVFKQAGLSIIESEARKIICCGESVVGLEIDGSVKIKAVAVILTCGTFLNGLIHIGRRKIRAGRMGEEASDGITESLVSLGFLSGRLKTGTPPRLRSDSINWGQINPVLGDENPRPFSFKTSNFNPPNLPCHFVNTNPITHEIISEHLHESPMYCNEIVGVGPRYCPSIEDKIVRFSNRGSHHLFLEPEWRGANQIYTNGFSTSLPEKTQLKALRTVRGLENVSFFRPGYAIEYDFFLPSQLKSSLETKDVAGLFFAGQLNGTSGYEEAAAQGLLAGVNASRFVQNKPAVILGRDNAYMGVLIDDLVTKDTLEPYRMFTSHAEYRLLLRHTNADLRLSDIGRSIGLLDDVDYKNTERKRSFIERFESDALQIRPSLEDANALLSKAGEKVTKNKLSIAEILRRPAVTINDVLGSSIIDNDFSSFSKEQCCDLLDEMETIIKYDGYIDRQNTLIKRLEQNELSPIPNNFNYNNCGAISLEAREKLSLVRPQTIGQASRISGVSPADVAALSVLLLS
ncbi:MAG: tRNA uridine-5-carboxymethylaminomethyl(34) synthesis enzyme MnmG [Candidatus Neomarinimicrobiota bacterium]